MNHTKVFDASKTIHKIKHFLPAQSPLKDFVHHNLLHFFQEFPFHHANRKASEIFGYKTYLSISEFRSLYDKGVISETILEKVIEKNKGKDSLEEYKFRMLYDNIEISFSGKIGDLMRKWKYGYKINLSKFIQPKLFRLVANYLDQGISVIEFPYVEGGLLDNLRNIESNSFTSYFLNKKGRARKWLMDKTAELQIQTLLTLLVGDESWFEDYLFDLCFEHPGWSGMVSVLEDHPEFLIKKRSITLEEFILLELLFQVDYLDYKLKKWKPLSETISFPQQHILETIHKENFHFELLRLWQEAFEWSYYEKVLHYISVNAITYKTKNTDVRPDFQTIHCIDDREESFRRYLEMIHPECETFSAAGFFNIDAYYQPEHSDYRMKIAPAPAQPNHVITEKSRIKDENKDIHIESRKKSHLTGLVISQTLGIQAGWRLAMHIFRPQKNPLTIDSAEHTHPSSELILEENNTEQNCELKKGFSLQDAYIRAENFLKTTGLTRHFASVVYIIAHGAGSTNNPYYAAYDCGACSGKAGSVNARAMSYFLNKKEIREKLKQNRISIPDDTVFIPCLHNSTTDDILFYDTEKLEENKKNHLKKHREIFQKALDLNSVERARRFGTLEMKNKSVSEIHQEVRKRQYALFEVRPEYNHATNAVCVVGRRTLTRGLFLDRRCFLQSYDYKSDRDGTILANILKAVTPVCGGINLEYYYSRVDCEKLGAGSKLPHNIFGLLSVANGAEGDLRIGLPMQMTEIHDPLRLLMIVEHFPEIVLKSVAKFDEVYEWYKNEWIHLMVIHPENENLYYFRDSNFHPYSLSETQTPKKKSLDDLLKLFPKTAENIDPFILQ